MDKRNELMATTRCLLENSSLTHLIRHAYQYDANGNQIERRYRDDDSTRQIVWDEDNRMECVHEYEHQHPSQIIAQQPASCQSTASSTKDSGNSANNNSANNGSHAPEVRFTYNDKGERVYKESHDNVSFYLNPHYTEKSDDAYKHILIGTTRLTTKEVKKEAEYEDDQYYYHPDHLGSSSFVTDTEGKLEEHLEYFPFGETWVEEESSLPIAFRFTAKELDSETNLYYFGARYYDPRTSVWQSADPILGKYLPSGGSTDPSKLAGMGGAYNSLNLAMYTYGHQNPVKFTDPDGNSIEKITDGVASGKDVFTNFNKALVRAKMDSVNAIVLHRTVSSTANSAINSAINSKGTVGFH